MDKALGGNETEPALADIVLGEVSGQAWLVRGEQHIDDLLGNMVPPDVSIEVVACESKSAVDALWRRWNDGETTEMWLIHPAILNRVRGAPSQTAIVFATWSVAIDADALKVIALTVQAAADRADAVIALVRHVTADGGRTADDLGSLRCTLIEGQLMEAGIPASRLARDTKPAATPAHAEWVELLLR